MSSETKTIIVSDVHASNGSAYSWFRGNYRTVTIQLLNQIAQNARTRKIHDLVLLGDILDLWLYPVDVVPWNTSQILQGDSDLNHALIACIDSVPNVYYTDGNHDMGVTVSDFPIGKSGKTIKPLPASLYPEWHLEHGHAVDMVNAPDPASDTIGSYPLGFFITRLAASSGDHAASMKVVHTTVTSIKERQSSRTQANSINLWPLLLTTIIDTLAARAGLKDTTPIRFSEKTLDGKYVIGDIKTHYGSLWNTWKQAYPDYVWQSFLTGLLDNGLDWWAQVVKEKEKPRVLIMGHTHFAEQSKSYVNDGCTCDWKDSGQITYAQVDNSDPSSPKTTIVKVPVT